MENPGVDAKRMINVIVHGHVAFSRIVTIVKTNRTLDVIPMQVLRFRVPTKPLCKGENTMNNIYKCILLVLAMNFPRRNITALENEAPLTTDTVIRQLFSEGQYEQAITILRSQSSQYKSQCCQDVSTLMEIKEKTDKLKADQEWGKAIEQYQNIIINYIDSDAEILHGLRGIARIYRMKKEYSQSENIYNQMLSIIKNLKGNNPRFGIPYAHLGELQVRLEIAQYWEEQGKTENAIKEYERLILLVENPLVTEKYTRQFKEEISKDIASWKIKISEMKRLSEHRN